MPAWICRTCAVQQPDTPQPPGNCPICDDERQYVGWGGQQWTTMAEIARDHAVVVREEEPGLAGIGLEPAVAIGQRALLVRTPQGNVLWDCVPLLDDAARARITELGGIDAICMSHPHFYAAHVDFADAFDARVLIPRADQQWIQRPSPRIELFDDEAEPVPGRHRGPDRRSLRRGGRAALARRFRRPRRPADRGHHHGRPGPGLGQLHVELPQPHPAGRGDGARDRPAGGAVHLRPGLRRLVGADRGRGRRGRCPPLGGPLRGPPSRAASYRLICGLNVVPARGWGIPNR